MTYGAGHSGQSRYARVVFSFLAILLLFAGGALCGLSLVLGAPVIAVGLVLGGMAFRRPGDMEWMMGLFLLLGIAWAVAQVGSLFGLWGL